MIAVLSVGREPLVPGAAPQQLVVEGKCGKPFDAREVLLLDRLGRVPGHPVGVETSGVLDFPAERKREEVLLTPEREAEIAEILAGVVAVRAMPVPPVVAKPMPICKKCAYEELCWG